MFLFRKKKKIEPESKDPDKDIMAGKDTILVLDEGKGEIIPCQVLDDHKIKFKYKKKEKTVEILSKPQVVKFNLKKLKAKRRSNIIQSRMFVIQAEGEMTHTIDPHKDGLTTEMKKQYEDMFKLHNVAKKAEIAANILAGLKGSEPWWKVGMWLVLIGFMIVVSVWGYVEIAKAANPVTG